MNVNSLSLPEFLSMHVSIEHFSSSTDWGADVIGLLNEGGRMNSSSTYY